MKRFWIVATVLCVLAVTLGCGGARTTTERNILEWGPILNTAMATNFEDANAFPESLQAVAPELREGLKTEDGWGNQLLYRRIRIDLYNLISPGPDGTFGNEDDIIMENGALYEPSKVYGEHPLE